VTDSFRQRLRLRFAKRGDARFLSHHDLMHSWEMALRRSGLPVKFTEGYNPRIRLSMPLALGLGIASEDEILEIDLEGWTPAGEIRTLLDPHLSPGIVLMDLDLVQPGQKGQVEWVEYAVRLSDADGEKLRALMDRQTLIVERIKEQERKQLDIRPYLIEIRREGDQDWRMKLRVTPAGTARPDEPLKAIGIEGPQVAGMLTKMKTKMEGAKQAT